MHVTNFTDDYDNITSSNYTLRLNDYDNMTLSNFTIKENNIYVTISSLLLTVPCGLSFLCLMSLMVHTLIKRLLANN